MLKNSVAAALQAVGLGDLVEPQKKRQPKAKYRVIGEKQVPHFYGGRIRKVRKIIRKIGPEAAANHPDLQGVEVKMVTVKRVQRI